MNVFTNSNPIRRLVTVWADRRVPVTRRVYCTHGLALALVKYLGDVALVYTATGALWTPFHYVRGFPALVAPIHGDYAATWLFIPALALWMLPFVVIGIC